MNICAAIIGMGIGQKHLEAIDKYKGSKVKIICEKNKNKVKILKKIYPQKIFVNNYEDIFQHKDINLVSIASYDDDHFNQILMCIKYNKNFIVEKPMCLNLDELKLIQKKLLKKKIFMLSNLVLRSNHLFQTIKKKIKKKNIFYIEADYLWGRINKLFEWRSKVRNYTLTKGAMIHMIDLINWIIELKPKHVYAIGSDKLTKNTIFKKKSLVLAVLEYPNNIIVKISANAVAKHEHFHELKIFTKDEVLLNNIFGKYKINNSKIKKIPGIYPDKSNRKNLIRSFVDFLKNSNLKPIMTHKEQFDLMKICFAIDNSLLSKKRTKIKYS